MDPISQPTDEMPIKCLVSSAIHRIAINDRYADGINLVIALLLQRLGGSVELTEAEARAFRETGQAARIEAFGVPEGENTGKGWKLTTINNDEAIAQSIQDILDTIHLLAGPMTGKEDTGLGKFAA